VEHGSRCRTSKSTWTGFHVSFTWSFVGIHLVIVHQWYIDVIRQGDYVTESWLMYVDVIESSRNCYQQHESYKLCPVQLMLTGDCSLGQLCVMSDTEQYAYFGSTGHD
jgi:hypothetical protein